MNRRDVLHSYMAGPLAVLALWEPWAILCVAPDPENNGEPAKTHETRHWFPRGVTLPFNVAIHAAKKYDKDVRGAMATPRFREALKRSGFYPEDPRPFLERKMEVPGGRRALPLGAIVGLATVVEVATAQIPPQSAMDAGVVGLILNHLTPDDREFGYFEPSLGDPHQVRYAWRLANTVLLPTPIPHSGRQDPLYAVDGADRELINQQLRWLEMGTP